MDFLTHLFLPITVAIVWWPDVFESPFAVALGGFGLLADFDKFLGMPGLTHSLVTIGPISLAVLGAEYWYRGQLRISPVIVALITSHLVLDFVDGGPVPLLFPFVDAGIGLQYPVRTVFGEGPLGVWWEGPIVTLRTATPEPGHNTYGFIKGAGIASLLAFVAVYWRLRDRRAAATGGGNR